MVDHILQARESRRKRWIEVIEDWVGEETTIAFHKPKEEVVIVRATLELRTLGPVPAPVSDQETQ